MTVAPAASSRTRILIIGPSNIGDAILSHEVIAAVHRGSPDAHVTLVVGARAQSLFADDPRIHTLVDSDAFDSAWGRCSLALALWRYRPHVVVDLRHTFYPILLKPFSAWRYLRQPPAALVHMRERHRWKLRAQAPHLTAVTSSTTADGGSALWLSAKDIAHVEALRRRWNVADAQRLVIICPGARSHIKRWGAEGFAQVADRLIRETHAHVVFSGEPDEESVVDTIRSLMRERAHSAVGLVTIRQVGALMRQASLVITNDSASLHLASALNVPTLAIFGPTDAAKYGPTAARSRTIRRRLFCAPCEQALCRFNHECMRFIGADEVFQAACELLRQGTGHKGQGSTDAR